jgi:hypothetical protein
MVNQLDVFTCLEEMMRPRRTCTIIAQDSCVTVRGRNSVLYSAVAMGVDWLARHLAASHQLHDGD